MNRRAAGDSGARSGRVRCVGAVVRPLPSHCFRLRNVSRRAWGASRRAPVRTRSRMHRILNSQAGHCPWSHPVRRCAGHCRGMDGAIDHRCRYLARRGAQRHRTASRWWRHRLQWGVSGLEPPRNRASPCLVQRVSLPYSWPTRVRRDRRAQVANLGATGRKVDSGRCSAGFLREQLMTAAPRPPHRFRGPLCSAIDPPPQPVAGEVLACSVFGP